MIERITTMFLFTWVLRTGNLIQRLQVRDLCRETVLLAY